MSTLRRAAVPLVILALVLAAGVWMFTGDSGSKTLVAHFPRTVALYEGSDVRVLGVSVGTVEKITPSGTDVVVRMEYDEDVNLPKDAQAVIIAPSIVGDRYVQITPVYGGGAKLADGATLAAENTSVPLELDQIYSSLNDLNVALGPEGANKNGALTDLLEVTADNFGGQGRAVPRHHRELQPAVADARRQQGGAVRLRRPARAVREHAGPERHHGALVQPVALRRLDDARR